MEYWTLLIGCSTTAKPCTILECNLIHGTILGFAILLILSLYLTVYLAPSFDSLWFSGSASKWEAACWSLWLKASKRKGSNHLGVIFMVFHCFFGSSSGGCGLGVFGNVTNSPKCLKYINDDDLYVAVG